MRFGTGFKPWPIRQPCYFPSALQQHLPPLALLGRDTRREQCPTSQTSQGASASASPLMLLCTKWAHQRSLCENTTSLPMGSDECKPLSCSQQLSPGSRYRGLAEVARARFLVHKTNSSGQELHTYSLALFILSC